MSKKPKSESRREESQNLRVFDFPDDGLRFMATDLKEAISIRNKFMAKDLAKTSTKNKMIASAPKTKACDCET